MVGKTTLFLENSAEECVLIVQSPRTVFCYWELSKVKKNMLQHHLNGNWASFKKTLRVYDITLISFDGQNAHLYFDYLLEEPCNQYFLKNLTPGRTYCMDIGIVTKEGTFLSIIRSNSINTPKDYLSEVNQSENAVQSRKRGNKEHPDWIDRFSSYSFYEKN